MTTTRAESVLRDLLAYYRHLCTPFISSSLTAGSFISNMPGSFLERGVTGGKDGSIHVFSFVLCLGKGIWSGLDFAVFCSVYLRWSNFTTTWILIFLSVLSLYPLLFPSFLHSNLVECLFGFHHFVLSRAEARRREVRCIDILTV